MPHIRWGLALLAFACGILATAVGVASAASLGILSVRPLGTSTAVVAACDSTIGLSWADAAYPAYVPGTSPGGSQFTVSRLLLTDVGAACDGAKFAVTLADAGGAALASAAGTLHLFTGTAILTFNPVNAQLIEQVTVTIYE